MNDKAFERAKKIKHDLGTLESLKRDLLKSVHVTIKLSSIECVRQPLAEAVGNLIGQLKEEYENL